MENFWETYQSLPLRINPVAFNLEFFSVSWYSVMYLVAFLVVYGLLRLRFQRKEINLNQEKIQQFLFYVFWGLFIGGRLGYVLFYDLDFYLRNPVAVISPFFQGKWVGIYGMSYHGGLMGVILAAFFFAKKNNLNLLKLSNWIIPTVPAGYFFGRIGNFLNGELFGRVTEKKWGMYFPGEALLRHPSQLYEAFFEGALLFLIFWLLRNKTGLRGKFLWFYFLGYALVRFGVEFFREPDPQIGFFLGFLTLGQIFSLFMAFIALFAFGAFKKCCIIKET